MALVFQIQVNDETPIRAGDDTISVLAATITYVGSRREIECQVGGLFADDSGNEHVDWLQRKLQAGDTIVVTVEESTEVDPPLRRTRDDPRTAEQMERRYYEQLKAKFEADR